MRLSALDRIIIQRKTIIKSINKLTKERNEAREQNRKDDERILNIRLSERHNRHNDIKRTQHYLEEENNKK